MATEEIQKINVWIPGSLWKQVGNLGYESPTKATVAAFEALVLQEAKGSNQEAIGNIQEEFRKLQEEIGRYQETILPNMENKIKRLEEDLEAVLKLNNTCTLNVR